VGERFLAPALWSLGIERVDYMVLSHPHPDHLQGLIFIARNLKIGEFWEGGTVSSDEEYLALKGVLATKGVVCRRGRAGIPNIPGVNISLLSMEGGEDIYDGNRVSDVNEKSLVFTVSINRFAVLFSGDIGLRSEERLLRLNKLPRCTILKVAHHGSRYSSSTAMLSAVAPEVAVISAGFRNVFGLPAASTLAALHASGARIMRTDLDGTVEVVYSKSSDSWIIRRLAVPFSLTSL
jgi:competence protein ComEC